ncbi:MAG: M20/M25/M40 family metallo-hydrolase [Gemmatimonadales bacterium]|nr:MAG: M20/M25/M40 family metallo-hydrolase [Gemmatimonadales bacterium]
MRPSRFPRVGAVPTLALLALFLLPALSGTTGEARAQAAPAPAVQLDPEIEALLAQVEPERLQAIVDTLAAFGSRNTMSDTEHPEWGIGAARDWILETFEGYSPRLQVEFDTYQVEPAGRIRIPTDLRNVKAILPGRTDRRVYVTGHYDSVVYGDPPEGAEVPDAPVDGPFDEYAPGANDDASGVAIVMELARILANSGKEFDATLVFMPIAGEEQGLVGAGLHAERISEEGVEVTAVFNNDIIGNSIGGNGILDSRTVRIFSEGPEDSMSRHLARYIHRIGSLYVPGHEIRLIAREDRFLRGGDHTPFNRAGFTAVRMTESRENYARQHTVLDTPDGIDAEYLARNARVNLAGVASLGLAPDTPGVTAQMLGRGDGYDAQLRWQPSEGAVGYRVFWRTAWGPDWQHELWVGDVTEFVLRDMSIDDFVFGVAAVGPDGHESLVAPFVRPPR